MTWSELMEPFETRRLASGLQVIAVHRPGLEFATVVTMTRGGSRADPPGGAGTAHLVEHVLARARAASGEPYSLAVLRTGGTFVGTTHPDYVEFCTETSYAMLPFALQAECVRLGGWPAPSEDEFARQLEGVCAEITQHCERRPSRELPWPALGPMVFSDWADAHDPFGEVEHVRSLTPDDCESFFQAHHRPGRSVVVVVADLSRVAGGFGAICERFDLPDVREEAAAHGAGRPVVDPSPGLRSGPGGWQRTASVGLHPLEGWAGPRSVGAAAWRVASVSEAPVTYAALLAVAAHLGARTRCSARLGQMTMMDRSEGDVLTVTVDHPVDAKGPLRRTVTDAPRELVTDRGVARTAIALTRTAVAARIDRPRSAAQLVARASLLAGDPVAAGRWVEAVRTLEPDEVAETARDLSTVEPVGLIGSPMNSQLEQRTDRSPCAVIGFERSTLCAAAVARLGPKVLPEEIGRLRSLGYALTKDETGWLLEVERLGDAAALWEALRRDLREPISTGTVRLVTVTGRGAERISGERGEGPWKPPSGRTSMSDRGRRAPGGGLEVRHQNDLPHGLATAELRWSVGCDGFVERWVGVALMLGLHTQDSDGRMTTLDAPAGSALVVRQDVSTATDLVIDAYAPPPRLADVLRHVAQQLSPPALRSRCVHTAAVAEALALGWERDAAQAVVLARRAAMLLHLGADPEDVRRFESRLRQISAEQVVDRIVRDTSGSPVGTVVTNDVDVLVSGDLPWSIDRSDEAMTHVM